MKCAEVPAGTALMNGFDRGGVRPETAGPPHLQPPGAADTTLALTSVFASPTPVHGVETGLREREDANGSGANGRRPDADRD